MEAHVSKKLKRQAKTNLSGLDEEARSNRRKIIRKSFRRRCAQLLDSISKPLPLSSEVAAKSGERDQGNNEDISSVSMRSHGLTNNGRNDNTRNIGGKEQRSDSRLIGGNRSDSRRASLLLDVPDQHGHSVNSPYVLGGLYPVSQSRTSAYNFGNSNESYMGNLQMPSNEEWERKRYHEHEHTSMADTPTDEDCEKELAKWISNPKKADPQSAHSSPSKQVKTASARSVEQCKS